MTHPAPDTPSATGVAVRQRAARAFARSSASELASMWAKWPSPPEVDYLRGPEPGLVMVQGRVGGRGDRFNLGEAAVTRATVRLHGGELSSDAVGTSYVLGSDTEQAGLAAIFDALLTLPEAAPRVLTEVVGPIEARLTSDDDLAHAQARSTVVDFLTVAREHE